MGVVNNTTLEVKIWLRKLRQQSAVFIVVKNWDGLRVNLLPIEEHWAIAAKLKSLRQPCRMVKCKNPGMEDGYCDTNRPFNSDEGPLRQDWLENKGLIKSNNPKCPYSGKRNATKAYRGRDATKSIEAIREFLNG